ncbi:hypothetical protein ACVBEH_07785 [Roseateles sp. GG27B]
MEADPAQPTLIVTERGAGYRLPPTSRRFFKRLMPVAVATVVTTVTAAVVAVTPEAPTAMMGSAPIQGPP